MPARLINIEDNQAPTILPTLGGTSFHHQGPHVHASIHTVLCFTNAIAEEVHWLHHLPLRIYVNPRISHQYSEITSTGLHQLMSPHLVDDSSEVGHNALSIIKIGIWVVTKPKVRPLLKNVGRKSYYKAKKNSTSALDQDD